MPPSCIFVTANPKTLLLAAVVMLGLSAVFGWLNHTKVTSLVAEVAEANTLAFEQTRVAEEKEKARAAAVAEAKAKMAENESKIAKAEADLVELQKAKGDLETKVQASEAQVATLQQQIEQATGAKPGVTGEPNPGAGTPAEMQAQLDEARQLLEGAEREKALLIEKLAAAEEQTNKMREQRRARETAGGRLGVRGTVLAVNQAYNFVVLNLGGRQGVEANSEMLVLRNGTTIGRIRISSVEPATAIGDIVTSSLERGVQVQPGDTVIYAGSNS